MKRFDHFSHLKHTLNLVDSIEESGVPNCNCCDEVMSFPGYACHESATCNKFYLHESCAKLPKEISHPLDDHTLTLRSLTLRSEIPGSGSRLFKGIICYGCRYLYKKGFTYYCSWCQFNLHPKCASKVQDHEELNKEVAQLCHIYHKKHPLNFCKLRHPNEKNCCCCKQRISGSAYCCLQCRFFIHESCKEIPEQVQHPFHPQHLLIAEEVDVQISGKICCNACKSSIGGIKIGCNKCAFQLHVSCANPSRYACALKNDSHQHNMYYFVDDTKKRFFECNECHKKCFKKSFYRCVECDFNLHLECIPIPRKTDTQKHHHPLTRIDSVKKGNPLIQYIMDSNDKVDYSMDYYCDDCEKPGNPKHHAYCCTECIYIAHMECIISKEQEGLESKEKGRKDTIHHFFHQHQLNLRFFMEYSKGSNINPFCCWCYKEINGPGYCCIDCKFFIHDFCCMEISPQLQHPLHPHPLHLKHNFAHDGTTRRCRACRNPKVGSMLLSCEECNFDLHSACDKTMKLSLKHECHNHNLYFAFDLKNKEDNVLYCNKCQDTGGSFYCCRECDINFHFECIPLPCDVKHKCHTHPLTLTYSPIFEDYYRDQVRCAICKAGYLIAGHPIFLCAECQSFVHIECAILEDDTAVEVLKYLNPRTEKEQRSSTEDHCGRAELDQGNGKMETLALELEALEEKHANKESEDSLDQKILYLDPTTSEVMNKVDEDHDQERKEADDRLLSSLDKSEKAEDETAEVQAAKTSEEDLVELDKKIVNVKKKMEALSSEIELLVKSGQGAEIIRAKIQALVSELDDARKIVSPITS